MTWLIRLIPSQPGEPDAAIIEAETFSRDGDWTEFWSKDEKLVACFRTDQIEWVVPQSDLVVDHATGMVGPADKGVPGPPDPPRGRRPEVA